MKKKSSILLKIIGVLVLIAVLGLLILQILKKVKEVRIKAFETEVKEVYKSMIDAIKEYQEDFSSEKINKYAKYFASGSQRYGDYSNNGYDMYANFEKECPTEFWNSSKSNCQYFYVPSEGLNSLILVVEIPKKLRTYYEKDKNILIGNPIYSKPICQLVYAPEWFNPDTEEKFEDTFMFLNCGKLLEE